jgi:hypothetical protein
MSLSPRCVLRARSAIGFRGGSTTTYAGTSGSEITPWERTSWIDPTRTHPGLGDHSAVMNRKAASPRRSETATTQVKRSKCPLERVLDATYRW